MTIIICAAIGFIIGIVAGVQTTNEAYLRKAAEEIRKEAEHVKKGN